MSVQDEVYKRLAKHLDHLPGGFPETETGVEIRILRRLFTPEEARIACDMTLIMETPQNVAQRTGRDETALSEMLEAMSKKGLLFRSVRNGEPVYMAAQFVIGIWEYHVNDLSEELIRDFNEYVPRLMDRVWRKTETKQLRVVPVNKSLSAEMRVMPYDVAENLIREQSRIAIAPCICRREREMEGEGCGKLTEACLIFGGGAWYYEQNGLGRAVSPEEALSVLSRAAEEGLVLQPGNAQKPMNICMCCGCCCQILRNLNRYEEPANLVASNYVAESVAENCTACESCREICQMAAITVADTATVDPRRCIGCGLCIVACDYDAMRLVERPAHKTPPEKTTDTYISIARERGLI